MEEIAVLTLHRPQNELKRALNHNSFHAAYVYEIFEPSSAKALLESEEDEIVFDKEIVDLFTVPRVEYLYNRYERLIKQLKLDREEYFSYTQHLNRDFGLGKDQLSDEEKYMYFALLANPCPEKVTDAGGESWTFKVCPFGVVTAMKDGDIRQATEITGHDGYLTPGRGSILWPDTKPCGAAKDVKYKFEVKLQCGLKYELVDVHGVDACSMVAEITTPVACPLQAGALLDAGTDKGNPEHDEL
mmetsp:Transcript_33246/g.93213  ORF Transcript_33246/g.93213 Transcript_33246/m.93213 type:complete len:244 (+) Transcript_33246:896-1627(+)